MLRVTTVRTDKRLRLVLEGELASPWVAELFNEWNNVRASARDRRVVVDLRNVTMISEEGEEILFGMMSGGARFICRGVHNRHVLRQLTRKHRELNRRLASL